MNMNIEYVIGDKTSLSSYLERGSSVDVNFTFVSIFIRRERRIENEVERVAELQGGRAVSGEGEGATGGLAIVSVQSIESVKVRTFFRYTLIDYFLIQMNDWFISSAFLQRIIGLYKS